MVDWTKPILWDGKPARVLATDLKDDEHCIVLGVQGPEREWVVQCREDGTVTPNCQRVTNAPARVERWANVYGSKQAVGCAMSDRALANFAHDPDRTALVRYTFENDKLVDVAIVPLEGE